MADILTKAITKDGFFKISAVVSTETAEQARKFVLTNTHRYIPKFAVMNPKNKASWNWMSFLFPCGWFLSRKMYKSGIVIGLLSIIATVL